MYHYDDLIPKINTYCFFKLSSRKIRSDDLGVTVELEDYDNIEAFIPITEINRKKFNIQTFFKYNEIYVGIVYSVEPSMIMISYSKIKEDKRNQLLKSYEYQKIITQFIDKLKTKFPSESITNPVKIDMSNSNEVELKKIYMDIILDPKLLTSNLEIIKYIETNRKISKPIYNLYFTLLIVESNGLEKLKTILSEINKEYMINIVSSPLYLVEFYDQTEFNLIKEKLSNLIEKYDVIFELKDTTTVKETDIYF